MLKDASAIKLEETYTTDDGKKSAMTREIAESMVVDHKAAIIIPKAFSEKVHNGDNAEVIVIADPVDRVIPGVVNDMLSKYTAKLSMGNIVNEVGVTAVQS